MSRKRGGASLVGSALAKGPGGLPGLPGGPGAPGGLPGVPGAAAPEVPLTQEQINSQNESSDTVSNVMRLVRFPFNYIVNPLIGISIKSINNYRLTKKMLYSATLRNNKFQPQYNKLTEAGKQNFMFACKLVKKFYHPDIGKQYEVLRISKEIHRSCLEHRNLDLQYKLFNSVNEVKENKQKREDIDFVDVFNGNSQFKFLYEQLLQLHSVEPSTLVNINYATDDAIHQKIEELFMKGKKNCSYMIPYIMHDIVFRLNKYMKRLKKEEADKKKGKKTEPDEKEKADYGYMSKELIAELSKIENTTIKEDCDSVFSLVDVVDSTGINKLVESGLELPVGTLPEFVKENIKKAKAAAAAAKMQGGSKTRRYKRSKRTFPTKRRLTTRRVKVIK
jgi:hypothetical protein